MEFIEESLESLKNHLMENGLKKQDKNFHFISSISSLFSIEDINIFLLGTLINREKTPRDKFYLEDNKYKIVDNVFDLYFAIHSDELETLAVIFRIFNDFESTKDGLKFSLLNGLKELEESPFFIKNFFKKEISSHCVFIKVSMNVASLLKPKEIKEVKKVEMITQKFSAIKKDNKEKKKSEVVVSYVDKSTSKKLQTTKIITKLSSKYEKVTLKKKDKR